MLSVHTSPLAPLGGRKTGGMNVYVREVARALGRRGIQVDVFTREASPETRNLIQPIGDNARLIYLPAGPSQALDPDLIYPYLPDFRDALLRFIRQENVRYDLIFSHYWLSGWVAQNLQKTLGIPFVQMFHTLGQMKQRIAEIGKYKPVDVPISHEKNIRIETETEVMERADQLIASTQAERIQMLWLYRADRRKISIVSPGVDATHFHPIEQEMARTHVGLAPNEKMLLFVGRIERLKGVETICEALGLLKSSSPYLLRNISVKIVGGDPTDRSASNGEMMRLQDMCGELGLENVIQFIGARQQEELPYFYNAAEALIMPSDYESFGLVALEAMACGTPVIASKVGGLAFLVEEGQTGFHVPAREPEVLADRIRVLLESPERRDMMGRAAYNAAQHYSWKAIVDQLLQVFSDVIIKHQPVRFDCYCHEA
jgi:D-inositol-3-phosphate glycosyltransferase